MGPNCTHAEGFILGVGAKMLTIAGTVILYGMGASVVYGLVYWIAAMIQAEAVFAAFPVFPEVRIQWFPRSRFPCFSDGICS